MKINLKEKAISILFPRICPICGGIVNPKGKLICEECKSSVGYIREPKCRKCGKPLQNDESAICVDCKIKKHEYTQGVSVFEYKDCIKQSI